MGTAERGQKVSVCIPAYNCGMYIAQTLGSIVRQSHRNIEVIVSDNASSDDTARIVAEFSSADPRVRLLSNGTNCGYTGNIARAVDAAGSNVICIFHADDIYDERIIELELDAMIRECTVSAIFVRPYVFHRTIADAERTDVCDALRTAGLYRPELRAFVGGLDEIAPAILSHGNFIACPSLMTYRDAYSVLGGFTASYPSNEDLHLWIRYLLSGRRLCVIDSHLMYYRRSATQGSAFWERQLSEPVEFRVIERELLTAWTPPDEARQQYLKRKSLAILEKAFLAAETGRPAAARRLRRRSVSAFPFPRLSKEYVLQRNLTLGRWAKRLHRAAGSLRDAFR